MDKPDNELSDKQKQFVEFLEKASNQDKEPPDDQLINEIQEEVKEEEKKEEEKKEVIHLNSLITKNISLFTKNPNYKLLAWLIVQLIIFSLFVFAVNIFKINLIPYFNA